MRSIILKIGLFLLACIPVLYAAIVFNKGNENLVGDTLLLKGGLVANAENGTEEQADVLIVGDRIKAVGKGLVANGDKLEGFTIAGADHKFHWADAKIVGDCVEVSCKDVPRPLAVRYAWADNPLGNLYNTAGLPASPFRTDAWPGVTCK